MIHYFDKSNNRLVYSQQNLFAFDPNDVINDLENRGFKLVDVKPCDSIKGLKGEVSILKPFLQYPYDKKNHSARYMKRVLDGVLRHFANHTYLLVRQKVGVNWN